MDHELQPQTQLAEATPQMQPESRGFLQNVLARSNKALAIGASVVALGSVVGQERYTGTAEAASTPPEVDFGTILTPQSSYALRGSRLRYTLTAYGTAEVFSSSLTKHTSNTSLMSRFSTPQWTYVEGKPTWKLGKLTEARPKRANFSMYVARNARIGSYACIVLRNKGAPSATTQEANPDMGPRITFSRHCAKVVRKLPR